MENSTTLCREGDVLYKRTVKGDVLIAKVAETLEVLKALQQVA